MTLLDRLQAYLEARPYQWVSMHELAQQGGIGGWRTRLSDLRLRRGLIVEWNGLSGARSRHRYVPQAPARPETREKPVAPTGGEDRGPLIQGTLHL